MGTGPWEGLLAAAVGIWGPIERALVDWASFVDFSTIDFCFASSLANMGTRSAGIGLLSCSKVIGERMKSHFNRRKYTLNCCENLRRSASLLSFSFLTICCFFWTSRCFSLVTKSRKLPTTLSTCRSKEDQKRVLVSCSKEWSTSLSTRYDGS